MTRTANSASQFYCWELLCVHPAVSAGLTGRYHSPFYPQRLQLPGTQAHRGHCTCGFLAHQFFFTSMLRGDFHDWIYGLLTSSVAERETHQEITGIIFSSGRTEAFQRVSLAPSLSWEPYGCEKLIIPGSSSSLSKRIKQIHFTFNYFIMSAVWKTVLSKIQHIMKP